jgi:hypothetical protein
MILQHRALAGLWVVLVPFGAFANVYTVGPGGGFVGCTHATVQAAVNAAAAHAGPDEIRISMGSGGYTNQAIVIDAQDVTLMGGFTSCDPFAPTGRTRLSGAGGVNAPVLKIQSTTGVPVHVDIDRLELVDGDNLAQLSAGGGLGISARGEVRVTNTRIANNRAWSGAGISIVGDLGDTATRLIVGDNVQIEDNTGVAFGNNGGGIDVYQAYLRLGGVDTVVRRNTVDGAGAGLMIRGTAADRAASVDITSGGQGNDGILSHNTATSMGGGLFVGDYATVRAFTTDSARPVIVAHNRSVGSYGGAVYARSATARVTFWESVVSENRAQQGGGAFIAEDGARIAMYSGRSAGAPAGTVACPSNDPCNVVYGHTSDFPDGVVALVRNADPAAESSFEIDSGVIAGNVGSNLFSDRCGTPGQPELCGRPASVYLSNTLVAPNFDAGSVLAVRYGADFGCDLCTIASNGVGSTQPLFDTNGRLALTRSIVSQPGLDVIGGQVPSSLVAIALLLHDASDFPVRPDIRVGDPRFLAQGAGDFRVAANSPALDSAGVADAPTLDLDGVTRVIDQPGVPNRLGPMDLGAYERAIDTDVIFVHAFE